MGTELQKRPVDNLKAMMNNPNVQEQFRNALGENSSLFVASLIDVFTSEKTLQRCNPAGVIAEALKAATLKLPINKSLGFAYIVPYNGQAQFQLGYKGMIQLAMRSGIYRFINAGPIFEGELVSIDKLTGMIDLSGEKKTDIIIGYFGYIETINGFNKSMYMSKEDMIKHAERFSKAYKFGPWKSDFDAMARKTMLRRLLSTYGPMSVDMANGIANDVDQQAETDLNYVIDDAPQESAEENLNARFSGNSAPPQQEPPETPQPDPGPQPKPADTQGERKYILCPDEKNGRVPVEYCEQCPARTGCPEWPEDVEQQPSSKLTFEDM